MQRTSFADAEIADYADFDAIGQQAQNAIDELWQDAIGYYQGQPDDVAERDAQPDNVPAMKSKSLLTIIGSFLGAIGLGAVQDLKGVVEGGATLFGAISNPWAFGSLVFATTGAVVLTWLVGSGRITINRSAAP